jgi:hypothetical protein
MGTRIENPNLKGACFIAENILLRLNKDAGRRCGSFDRLYAVFLKKMSMSLLMLFIPLIESVFYWSLEKSILALMKTLRL